MSLPTVLTFCLSALQDYFLFGGDECFEMTSISVSNSILGLICEQGKGCWCFQHWAQTERTQYLSFHVSVKNVLIYYSAFLLLKILRLKSLRWFINTATLKQE